MSTPPPQVGLAEEGVAGRTRTRRRPRACGPASTASAARARRGPAGRGRRRPSRRRGARCRWCRGRGRSTCRRRRRGRPPPPGGAASGPPTRRRRRRWPRRPRRCSRPVPRPAAGTPLPSRRLTVRQATGRASSKVIMPDAVLARGEVRRSRCRRGAPAVLAVAVGERAGGQAVRPVVAVRRVVEVAAGERPRAAAGRLGAGELALLAGGEVDDGDLARGRSRPCPGGRRRPSPRSSGPRRWCGPALPRC